MSAQQRTLDDLRIGVNVQIDKSGRIRFREQPQMGLPSLEVIAKQEIEPLLRVARATKKPAPNVPHLHDLNFDERWEAFVVTFSKWRTEQLDALKEVEGLLK